MRVLICGSREWPHPEDVEMRIAQLPAGTVVIHGGARGVDRCAHEIATQLGLHTAEVRPLWDHFGKQAGPIRNAVMLDLQPDLVIAFQHNGSSGTQGTIDEAKRRGIPVEVHPAPESLPREGR